MEQPLPYQLQQRWGWGGQPAGQAAEEGSHGPIEALAAKEAGLLCIEQTTRGHALKPRLGLWKPPELMTRGRAGESAGDNCLRSCELLSCLGKLQNSSRLGMGNPHFLSLPRYPTSLFLMLPKTCNTRGRHPAATPSCRKPQPASLLQSNTLILTFLYNK